MRGYSRVHQLGFVVRDLEKAMSEYGKIYKVKKWYGVINNPQGDLFYKGQKFTDDGYDMRIGYSGSTEIELITTAREDNIYGTFLKQCGEGLHHISFFVKDIRPYVEEYKKMGFEVLQNGTVNGKTMNTNFAYLQIPGEGFTRIVEFSDVKTKGGMTLSRNRYNIGIGTLTGDLYRIK